MAAALTKRSWNLLRFSRSVMLSSLKALQTRTILSGSINLLQNIKTKPNFSTIDNKEQIVVPASEESTRPEEDALNQQDFFNVHQLVSLRDLFVAGVHYGHHEGCWNPLMKPYLYGTREHFHIIDLNQTIKHFRLALDVLCHTVYRGGKVLFISCKPQFEELTQSLARDSGEYFVTQRWRGGTFTNSYMVLETRNLPDLVVFLHVPSLGRNALAVKETAMCNIPSIGIVDSDCNPNLIMYPIPGNDDMPSAVQMYCRIFKSAVLTAKEKRMALLANRNIRLTSKDAEVEEEF